MQTSLDTYAMVATGNKKRHSLNFPSLFPDFPLIIGAARRALEGYAQGRRSHGRAGGRSLENGTSIDYDVIMTSEL